MILNPLKEIRLHREDLPQLLLRLERRLRNLHLPLRPSLPDQWRCAQ